MTEKHKTKYHIKYEWHIFICFLSLVSIEVKVFWKWTHFPAEQIWWGYFSLWQEEGHSDIVWVEHVWKTGRKHASRHIKKIKFSQNCDSFKMYLTSSSSHNCGNKLFKWAWWLGNKLSDTNIYCWEKFRQSQELSEAMSARGDLGWQAFHTTANTASFPSFTKTKTGRKLSYQCWENTDLSSYPSQVWSWYCSSLRLAQKNDMAMFVIMNRCVSYISISKKQK